MKKTDRTFHLLRDIMQTAFHVECYYVKDVKDFSSEKIDHGLREAMWANYHSDAASANWVTEFISQNSVVAIRSNLGFYNILISLIDNGSNIFLIGPFRTEAATPIYFERIVKESHVPQEKVMAVQSIFRNLPIVSLSAIIATTQRILADFYPEFREVSVKEKKFVGEKHVANLNQEENKYLSSYWEDYKTKLSDYLRAVTVGDLTTSRLKLKDYLDYCMFDTSNSLEDLRRIVVLLNDYTALALFSTNVHPYRIFRLQNKLMEQIYNTEDGVALSYIVYDICHKYNLLVKNHNYTEYSKIVRDIINYIELHLNEDLTLETFADMYGRNASTLSAQFHKETKTTLVSYIKNTRVSKAILLLNTTEKSISEIAIEVGYEDFAYFSRVFKQITGISPRAYKFRTLN